MGIDRLLSSDRGIARREFLKIGAAVGGVVLLNRVPGIHAQDKKRISVATGGMGGVYFVLGGGVASVLTKYAGVEATAEVTAASVDNCKLVGAKKADLAFSMNDVAYDAFKGQGNFKSALPLRTLCVTYPNIMHVVTTESSGIKKVADLKGKRVSTGAPGSGTEVKALRTLEAAGLNHEKDVKKDRLGAAESAGAMKDGKIDAYFWDGGVPTSSVMDLAASPGIKMVLIPTPVCGVANVILCHEAMEDALAYQITRVIFEHQPELQAIHKEATNLTLENGSSNKAVPYHPGAAKYFKEKGLSVAA